MIRTTVTAVLVAQNGGEWLDQTLAALHTQTHSPDRTVAIVTGGNTQAVAQLTAAGVTHIITAEGTLPYGSAVQRAVSTLPPAENDSAEWLWLLTEDAAPEPQALELILTTVQRSPSVAIAGSKLVSWDHPERIIELGQSLTIRGDRWLLRRQELDQQQYDHLDDVLGVGPVGMLVRRDVWVQLDGFDPALPVYDDGLDLSVRARLAGYRVVVAPAARVRFAQLGIGGPRVDRSRRVIRQMHTQGRISQLHRKIAYAPAALAILMWALLPAVALGRVAWALIREQPGFMWGECVASLRVFFRPSKILASRRRIRAHQTLGWSTLRSLQVDAKTVRTTRMIDREAILAAQGRLPKELHFVSTGGLAVTCAAAVLGVALTWWVFVNTSVMGAALAPLNDIGTLWQNTRTFDGVPADPFAWVLAMLGSLTFWHPSLIVVVLLACALPVAAMGGWLWGAQLTDHPAGRALVGLGWALSPVLLGTLDSGRLPTLLLAMVLPWFFLAATRSRESWSWAGTASLLAAVVFACAPILIPAGILCLVVSIVASPRGATRLLTVAIAPLALFAPKLIALFGDDPLTLVLDPGMTPAVETLSPWHFLLGFAGPEIHTWGEIFTQLGWVGLPVSVILAIGAVPLIGLAIIGAITAPVRTTLMHALVGGSGFLTAVIANQVSVTSDAGAPVSLWAGSGVLVFWAALLGLAGLGAPRLRQGALPTVTVALVGILLLSGPLAVKLVMQGGSITSAEQQMPAIVQASGAIDPAQTTLVVHALDDYQIAVTAVTGAGLRLDSIRTVSTAAPLSEQDTARAGVVAQLTSSGNQEALETELIAQGIRYVLLSDTGSRNERAYLHAAFDQQAALVNVGLTDQGVLWRVGVAGDVTPTESAQNTSYLEGTTLSGNLLWILQIVVLVGVFLLALPTGEVVERPEKRKRTQRLRPRKTAGITAAAGAPTISGATSPAETVPGATHQEPASEDGTPSASAPAEASHTVVDAVDESESEAEIEVQAEASATSEVVEVHRTENQPTEDPQEFAPEVAPAAPTSEQQNHIESERTDS